MPQNVPESTISPPHTGQTLGGRIQLAREARSLTIAQLARRAGVLTETVRRWELDRSEPRVHKLQILSGVLRVPMMWLLGGSEAHLADDTQLMTDETSDLSNKLERIIDLHARAATLMFEMQSEIRRMQSDMDHNAATY